MKVVSFIEERDLRILLHFQLSYALQKDRSGIYGALSSAINWWILHWRIKRFPGSPPNTVERAKMAKRMIYLVRHGQQDQHGKVDDELESGLTSLGRAQAEQTANRMREFPISAIYSSSLRRAAETAHIIAVSFPEIIVQTTRELWECVPCFPEKFRARWPNLFRLPLDLVAESKCWADRSFQRYFKPARGTDKHVLLVCHGNLIRYFVCLALELDPETWAQMDIYNCGLTQILIESDGLMKLVSHNDVGHLPPAQRTFA